MHDRPDFQDLVSGMLIQIHAVDPEAYRDVCAILAQEPAGEERAVRLAAALSAHAQARDLIAAVAASGGRSRGGWNLLGNPQPQPLARYHCPEAQEGCPVRWARDNAGEPIPVCPTHNQQLIPDTV